MQVYSQSLPESFSWCTWNLNSVLAPTWRTEIIEAVQRYARRRVFTRNEQTREENTACVITSLIVTNEVVNCVLPWLDEIYEGIVRDLAQSTINEPVSTAVKKSHRVALNAQLGQTMRHECHVDSNPLQALLYVTDHPRGCGGETVVANRPDALTVTEVDEDCTVIYPIAGSLVVFDARYFPHYVRPLAQKDGLRIVAAMNYYLPSCPE